MTEQQKSSDPAAKTQLTQPKKGEPVEIPVPKREEFKAAIRKAMRRPDRTR